MSGIEIVGVVLGALPLITSLIDQYRVSKRIYKVFRYKEPYIDQLIQSLRTQNFFLETDILVILKETFGQDFVQSIPDFAQASSTLFEDPEVSSRIEEYLGDGYAHYKAALSRCEEILSAIAENISGLKSEKQTLGALMQAYPKRNGSYEITKKVKFALDRDTLQKKINSLDDATKMLSRIRENSSSRTGIVVHSSGSSGRKYVSSFDTIQRHAWRLYSALAVIYTKGCHPMHGANLFLESRADLLDRKHRTMKKKPVTFTLSFDPVGHTDNRPSHLAMEIKAWENDTLLSPSHTGLGSNQRSPRISYDPSINAPRLSYDENTSNESYSSSATTINDPANQAASKPRVVRDLCLHLSETTESIGFLLCQDNHLWCHQSTGTMTAQLPNPNGSVYSLQELMQPTAPMKLLLNPRMALSFRIASSIMQLNSTKWLHRPLTSDMINIASGDGGSGIRPFIGHSFCPGLGEPQPYQVRRGVLELGILLLELWHSRTFVTYAAEANVPLTDSFAIRYEAARGWLDSSRDEVLPYYLTVVTRCVERTFFSNTADLDWNDTAFRESFFEHVVKPLWENCPVSLR
ncbi:hypothetical protein N7541_000989 [Penicillium brevicompactum]|uniref:DUF7580 domain-containing protein n=1 Tax=Penicillium brevicompactum TaxID=5074 RepID=A0A9W9S035_PENBR|nr:hypothetical protein N7541_000989 [Penicillium brevicompactum]